jgi:hypothetical protein
VPHWHRREATKLLPAIINITLKPLFMSELRIREIVKRLFTPYQLSLLKRRELTDSTRPRRCRLDKSEREVHENGRFVSRQRGKERYKVIMLSDATATWSEEEHAGTLNTFIMFFGDVMTTNEAIPRLTPVTGRNTA